MRIHVNGRLLPEYCNLRVTRMSSHGDMTVETDFEMSVSDAVETGMFHNLGVVDIHKVEWRGAHIGPMWNDITDHYKNLYHERTTYANA